MASNTSGHGTSKLQMYKGVYVGNRNDLN